jgi:uncharacterized RDD family membrane protein YckC
MKALIRTKYQLLAAWWFVLMAVSLTAQNAATQDRPAESEPAAESVSAESVTPVESGYTAQVDQPQSSGPQLSENASGTEDETTSAPAETTEEVATEVEETDSEEEVETRESRTITIESGVIRIEQPQGELEIQVPSTEPHPPEPEKNKRKSLQEVVRIFSDGVVGPNEVSDDFVVVGGRGIVEGLVDGDGVVILGNAIINGKVDGDFVNVLGTTSLGPDAEIEGQLVVIGRLAKAEGASVYGDVVEINFLPDFTSGQFKWVGEWFRSGLLMGRPLPHGQSWAWIAAGVLLLISLVISLIFRRAIDSTAQVLDSRPAASLLTGMLIFIFSVPLAFILTVSVIGILIIPFYMAGLMVAGVFGIIAVYRFSGQQLGLGSIPALALLAGGIIFTLLYAVPFVGFLTWFLAVILGTGAVFLALVKALKGESKGPKPTKAPMSPIAATPIKSTQPLATEASEGQSESDEVPIDVESAPKGTAITATPDDPLMAERVGFWPRLGATALDFILIAGLVQFTGLDWMLPFAWIAYHVAFWSWRQTTIGGIVLNLKVVRLDGQSLNVGVVAVRSLSSIFSGIVLGLGFFWASWDDERQSWHDKIAGTTIIRVPKGTSLL